MVISLIGMASAGKTHWAKRIEHAGYIRLSCDDIIENKLHSLLIAKGYFGLSDVARWMGHPYEKRYSYTSKQYLAAEEDAMNDILDAVEKQTNGSTSKIVVDTTGSVIYTSDKLLERLKQLTTVVYLEIPEKQKIDMATQFIHSPKPLIWGDVFSKHTHKDPKKALKHFYPKLLEYRSKRYQKLACLTLRFENHHSRSMNALDFIHQISPA